MMKIAPIGLAFALALSGCADSSVVDDGDGGGGSGSGSQEPQPEPQLDLQGTYRLNSTFDIVTNMPGTTGSVVNGLIEATDDPDDPMSWIVDEILEDMDDSTFKDALVLLKPFVISELNDQVTSLAPGFVATMTEIGQRMNDLFKEFGVDEKLMVNSVDQTYIARVTVDGIRFKVDTNTVSLLLADHDIDDVVVDGVLVTLENKTKVLIGEHTLALPYSQVVRLGLDKAIIPAIDSTATSLADLLDNQVDCAGVGATIAQEVGIGGSGFWTAACLSGLQAAADKVYDLILGADDKLDLTITGNARAVDSNNDYKLDKMAAGAWAGKMKYKGTDAQLAQPATFVGNRM